MTTHDAQSAGAGDSGPMLDTITGTVSSDGGAVKLTRTEQAILARLMRSPGRVLSRDRLTAEIEQSGEDGFGWNHYLLPAQQIMSRRWSRLACYAVKGSSEAYWVHLDLILPNDQRINIGMTKVWSWAAALALSNAATRILHE